MCMGVVICYTAIINTYPKLDFQHLTRVRNALNQPLIKILLTWLATK